MAKQPAEQRVHPSLLFGALVIYFAPDFLDKVPRTDAVGGGFLAAQ
jgi:hypothetical protein